MRGKRRISAILLAVTLGVSLGVVPSITYGEPQADAVETANASQDALAEAEKELTPEELEKKAEEDAYNMEIQSNSWKNWPQGPGTYGEAAIVMDAGTGSILYEKNINAHEYPASITKVLTTLVALKYGKLSDQVTFTNDCVSFMQPGDSSVGLKEGNVITLEQALYATLLASANEAAYAVAENVGKNAGHDYNWFIQQMNQECTELGGKNSNFVNANGLHDDNHYTCARDMALIGREIWRYPEFLKMCQEQSYTIPASDTTEEHVFAQHHKMLIDVNKNYYAYAVAGKTGYTSNALSTLITMADNGNMKLVCVVLRTHGVNIYPDTRNLFEYAFNNFQKINVTDEKKPKEVSEFIQASESKKESTGLNTSGSNTLGDGSQNENVDATADGNEYHVLEDGYVLLPAGVTFDDVKYKIENVNESTGEGTIKYTYNGHQVGSATARLSKEYLKKISNKKNVDSNQENVDNSEEKGIAGGKTGENFLNKIKHIPAFFSYKFSGKSDVEKYMITGGTVVLIILFLILFIMIIQRHNHRHR